MRKFEKFFNRLAEVNEEEFGKGRLDYQKLNQRRAKVFTPLPSHEPKVKRENPIIEAMKAADTINTPKCDICYLGEPGAEC